MPTLCRIIKPTAGIVSSSSFRLLNFSSSSLRFSAFLVKKYRMKAKENTLALILQFFAENGGFMRYVSIFSVLIWSLFSASSFAAVKNYTHLALDFKPGEATLSAQEKDKLELFLKKSSKQGKISDIELATWSDKELPKTGFLSEKDKELAAQRAKHIEWHIEKDLERKKGIEVFNMGESAGIYERIGRTKKAKADPSYAAKKADRPATEDVELIRQAGGASKALVILRMK